MYLHGHGTEKDEQSALKYFKKAADQGNAEAQFNLGAMYFGRSASLLLLLLIITFTELILVCRHLISSQLVWVSIRNTARHCSILLLPVTRATRVRCSIWVRCI